MIRAAMALAILLWGSLSAQAAPHILVPVPDVRQATVATCGPAALQAVLMYWGIDTREDELAAKLGCTPDAGTNRHALVHVARAYGLKATPIRPMTRRQLTGFLDRHIPVIIAIQAWRETKAPYRSDWDDGHYVVAVGYDSGRLYVEDPSILGSLGYLTWAELDERWHDCDLGPEDKYERLGIAIEGPSPPSRPAVIHVD